MRFQRAQVGDRARQREGQFLRFGAARIMDDAAIGDGERPRKPAPASSPTIAAKRWRKLVPSFTRPAAGSGEAADRIDAGAQIDLCRAMPRL